MQPQRLIHFFLLLLTMTSFIACSNPTPATQDEGDDGVTAGEGDLDTITRDAGQLDQQSMRDQGPATQHDQDTGDASHGGGASISPQEVFASFSTLETIAGTARIEDKGVNGWQSSFEGGPATSAELSRPHIAQAHRSGNIYIADKDAHSVRKVSPQGMITTFAGTNAAQRPPVVDEPVKATETPLNSPNGLWVSPSKEIVYILDLGNDRVVRVDEQGMLTTLFSIGGAGAGRGLWVAEDESLAYVSAGTQLKKWTPQGGVETLASGFVSLGNLHVSKDGRLAVTDRDGSMAYLIDAEGKKTHIAGSGSGNDAASGMDARDAGLDEVRGIWFHPQGGYFLATHKGGQIWYVDIDNKLHLLIDGDKGSAHSGDGEAFDTPGKKISEPRAVTMTPRGELLITEHDGGYIRRLNVK